MSEALPKGTRILDGRYILLRLLYERPRVNLYLGWRLPRDGQGGGMVAMRELVLSDLSTEARAQLEQAMWEEFLAPGVVSTMQLPGTWATERLWLGTEHGRQYLVLRLFEGRTACSVGAMPCARPLPLADLLQQRHWPRWLDMQAAVAWTIQLARIVARLRRLGTILVDLDPSTILVDEGGRAAWSPLLLPCWPPSPCYWPDRGREEMKMGDRVEVEDRAEASSAPTNTEDYFPLPFPGRENPFVAPELLRGLYDERAAVYAVSAILYLLLTRHAPVSARLRLLYEQKHVDGMELVSSRFFCPTLPLVLEEIVSRALALEPDERYPSVFALVEALEEVQVSQVSMK